METSEVGVHEPLLRHDESRSASPGSNSSSITRGGNDIDALQDVPQELQVLKSNAILSAQGHEAAMGRSFSPLAALGLGFRCVSCPA